MASANYAAAQVKVSYKKLKVKTAFVAGDLLDIIDSLGDSFVDGDVNVDDSGRIFFLFTVTTITLIILYNDNFF